MSDLKIGSLFSGYGGLDMAVESVTGAKTAWVSDIDKGACKILAHRYPDIPNHGDLTQIDWAAIEPVDIITGGFPCQDLSHAGKGAGMTSESRSGLWSYMRDAINIIRPRLVVAENVRGLLSAEALRPVEPCTWCVGDEPDFDLRALGSVLADLADIGYDASWYGLRAADVGACHGRWRCFVVAYPNGSGRVEQRRAVAVRSELASAEHTRDDASLLPTPRTSDTNGAGAHGEGGVDLRTAVSLLPTSRAGDGEKGGPNQRGSSGDFMLPSAVTHMLPTPRASRGASTTETFDLLPTPAVNDMGKAYTPEEWDSWTAKMKTAHGNGNGHGKSLEIEAARLLPTPVVTDAKDTRNATAGRSNPDSQHHSGTTLGDVAHLDQFGQYAAAIARWESVTGRSAPPPTEPTGKGGAHRLSPRFTEWMMGLPDGWLTDVPDITRNEALKASGNGVVWQQAAAAIRLLLSVSEVAA
jgi:DNA (cytosine-5)-methyltransferase 1